MTLKRAALDQLQDRTYDVVIVGAGINGCSAAQAIAADGYSVLLLDKGDFASGSSSRSSGLLHCGLRYLEPNPTIWEFVRRPDKLLIGLKMARQSMRDRHEFVSFKPGQAEKFTFLFPVYKDVHYKKWHIDLALRVLNLLGGAKSTPLNVGSAPKSDVATHPLLKYLRNPGDLSGVSSFSEYRFNWPERIAIDMALDASEVGAEIRNYTAVEKLDKEKEGRWCCHLRDVDTNQQATVIGRMVLNTAGIWMDDLNVASQQSAKPLINGTKGAHIVVMLPPEMANYGVVSINRIGLPFYGIPWRGMHYFGPTETHYHGDKDDLVATDEEISFLLDETNYLLPGLGLTEQDVLFTWAGVRPLGADKNFPEGKRSREIHDLGEQGLSNVFAMTAGPIMTHRSAGSQLLDIVRSRVPPSGQKKSIRQIARSYPEDKTSLPIVEQFPHIKESHVSYATDHEMPETLIDLMFRRLGLGWTSTLGIEVAEKVALLASDSLGWDEERRSLEIDNYKNYLDKIYRRRIE
jgi:glycerol-3-phosphate dehydrogenase